MLRESDCNFRAMTLADKERVLRWRNSERVRINMYNDHLITPAEHDRWFRMAIADDSARYLIFELNGRPTGFASFTSIVPKHGRCSWAFYLGETDVQKGAGTAMEYFALSYAFERLEIRKLCCEVFAYNAGVVKLHERFGFVHEGRFAKHFFKNGKYEDIVCLAKYSESWHEDKAPLRAKCFRAEPESE